jgi:D-arabinose 1-dehydrogenase-like Zn-dependent alcohol dehydrogenase
VETVIAEHPTTVTTKHPATVIAEHPATVIAEHPANVEPYNVRCRMKAMVLNRLSAGKLDMCDREVPIALPGEVLVRVRACGVCRTDLHIVDGELPDPELPLVPGHEIIGIVERLGDGVEHLAEGDRVGIIVRAGIHMSDVPAFPYRYLWGERVVRSVANLTRQDAREFLAIAPTVPVKVHVECYDLERANTALADLRPGGVRGAAVLLPQVENVAKGRL